MLFLGRNLMAWAFSDGQKGFELEECSEDARARKRRLQGELSSALAVLGVKHSTFHSMLQKGKHEQVEISKQSEI